MQKYAKMSEMCKISESAENPRVCKNRERAGTPGAGGSWRTAGLDSAWIEKNFPDRPYGALCQGSQCHGQYERHIQLIQRHERSGTAQYMDRDTGLNNPVKIPVGHGHCCLWWFFLKIPNWIIV